MEIGKRIREIRKAKKITLVELAELTGVAQATLSRIETGVMIGTIDSHQKIAKALGLSVAELYSGMDERIQNVTYQGKAERTPTTLFNGKIRCELLTSQALKRKISPYVLTLENSTETDLEKLEAGVEKFIYVLEGEVLIRVDKKEFPLKDSETLYFEASLPHQILNHSGKRAKVLCTVSPPAI